MSKQMLELAEQVCSEMHSILKTDWDRQCMKEKIVAAMRQCSAVSAMAWLPMSTAPRDRVPVLLKVKDRIPSDREDLRRWDGLIFVGRNYGDIQDWGFAAPVGVGGFPDEWFDGWNHICAQPQAAWQCAARKQGTPGGNAPADCDWPGCGCDPAANKVLEAIDEAGFDILKRSPPNEDWVKRNDQAWLIVHDLVEIAREDIRLKVKDAPVELVNAINMALYTIRSRSPAPTTARCQAESEQ